jgi:AraC family transcriptional regulator, exoenzyme S synthesis regulatory protein ExsA
MPTLSEVFDLVYLISLTMINYVDLLVRNPQSFKQFSYKEILFLNYDCPVKEKKLAKWSEHNYIYYVLTGQKILHTPTRSYTLTKGSALFVKKGACIVEQFFREPFCIVVFIMPDAFIRRFVRENDPMIQKQSAVPTSELGITIDANELLRTFYDSLLPYFGSLQNPPEPLIELKFRELLIHILNNPANSQLIDYMRCLADDRMATLEQVMEMNYAYNLPLEAYAKLCNRSLSSFKRDFVEVFKISPGKWLAEKKLTRSHFLVTTTDKPISDVALESGFENFAHFSKTFKQKFGDSPMNLRKNQSRRALIASVQN